MTAKQGILKGIIDVKKNQVWLKNVKYLRLSALPFMAIIHICVQSKVIGMNTENKIDMPSKEYTSVH